MSGFGPVNYSQEDGVFFGKIEGINGLVNFEGETVKQLENAFRSAVEDYKALCRSKSVEPFRHIQHPHHPGTPSAGSKRGGQKKQSINKAVKTALDHYLDETD